MFTVQPLWQQPLAGQLVTCLLPRQLSVKCQTTTLLALKEVLQTPAYQTFPALEEQDRRRLQGPRLTPLGQHTHTKHSTLGHYATYFDCHPAAECHLLALATVDNSHTVQNPNCPTCCRPWPVHTSTNATAYGNLNKVLLPTHKPAVPSAFQQGPQLESLARQPRNHAAHRPQLPAAAGQQARKQAVCQQPRHAATHPIPALPTHTST